MKLVSIFRFDPAKQSGPPDPQQMGRMGALIGEMSAAGVLVDTGGVAPTGLSFRVRRGEGGAVSVTDGPFAESKEIVGGFAVFDVTSKDEAVAWTKRFLELAGDGVCEMIEVTPTPF